jgi:hypothetical protein
MAAASLVLGLVGTVIQSKGQKKAAKAAKKAERARKLASDLEAARKRRQAARQSVVQRAQIIARGAAGGVDLADSSLVTGAAQPISDAARSVRNINQGQEVGDRIFAANEDIARGREIASVGTGIQNFSNQLFQSRSSFGRVFNFG